MDSARCFRLASGEADPDRNSGVFVDRFVRVFAALATSIFTNDSIQLAGANPDWDDIRVVGLSALCAGLRDGLALDQIFENTGLAERLRHLRARGRRTAVAGKQKISQSSFERQRLIETHFAAIPGTGLLQLRPKKPEIDIVFARFFNC